MPDLLLQLVQLGAAGAVVAVLLIVRPTLHRLIDVLASRRENEVELARQLGAFTEAIRQLPDDVGDAVRKALPCEGRGDCADRRRVEGGRR